jgi:hypothetical protein
MQSVWEEFLAWLAQTGQTILDVAPDAASQIASQSAIAFYQLKIIVGIEVPRFVGRFTPADLLVLAGLVCLILGIRMRLHYRGVFLYLFGLASLIVGLGNIVNPAGLPLLLRV